MGLLSFGKKARRQFHSSLEESHIQEQQALNRLISQQKALLKTLQEEKEETFKVACKQIKKQMEWLRAGLHACRLGEAEMVENLLKDKTLRALFFNFYPLHIAAEYQQNHIIKLLCQYGVNLHRVNAEGNSALELAVLQGHTEVVELLKRLAKESEDLCRKAKEGNLPAIKSALARRADINATDREGYTALQLALLNHQDSQTIHFLIKAKADIHALTPEGQNPLELAILSKQHVDVIRILLEAGAHVAYQSSKLGKTIEELASNHPNERVKAYLSEILGNQKGHFIEALQDDALSQKGPIWNESWNSPEYHSTIKSRFVTVNGQQQLFVLGRSSHGIQLHSYDFAKKQWEEHLGGPKWSDDEWKASSYYSTIQLQSCRVSEDQEKLLLLGRTKTGIELWFYDPSNQQWTLCNKGPTWSDKEGWNKPSAFMSIRTQMVSIEGQDTLFLLGKREGIELWSYDPLKDDWQKHPSGPFSEDKLNSPLFDSTLQVQTLRTAEGQKLLVLRMTPKEGIELWSYDLHTRVWTKEERGPNWCENNHWHLSQYRETLQIQIARVEGEERLFLLGRGEAGIYLWSYNPNTRNWKEETFGPQWSDKAEWNQACYGSTIRMNVIPGNGLNDIMTVFGRGVIGGITFAYYPKTQQWLSLPLLNLPAINNHGGWGKVPYYSTIQAHNASLQHQNRTFIVAKSRYKIQCWSHAINVDVLEKQFVTVPKDLSVAAPLDHEKLEAFYHKIMNASEQLLKASIKGDWIGVQGSLLQGADIHTVDNEGFNALQKAILSKKASPELVNGLLEAGIERDSKTLALAKLHVPEILPLLRDEPVLGQKTLTPLLTLEACKLRFEEHCERAQRFLDKYSGSQRLEAMQAYYAWLAKREPYALYAVPTLLMLNQLPDVLNKAEAVLPDSALKVLPKEQLLKSAEAFFKRTRAMHCLLNEVDTSLIDRSQLGNFEQVAKSVALKKAGEAIAEQLATSIQEAQVLEALYKTHSALFIEGTTSTLFSFINEVFGENQLKLTDAKTMALELLECQRNHQALLKEKEKEVLSQNPSVIQELARQGLIQLPPKLSLKQGLMLWEKGREEIQLKIKDAEEALKEEREALEHWLNQTETQWLERLKNLEGFTLENQTLYTQLQKTHVELKQSFAQYRQALEQSYQDGRKKSRRSLTKQLVALGIAALLAPQLAPHIVSAMGVTAGTVMAAKLTLVVEGALMGSMTSALSGNTHRILKDGFIGAWLAGFGMALGSVLEESTTIQKLNKAFGSSITLVKAGETVIAQGVVTQTIVAGMKAGVLVELEGGKLSPSLLTAMGSTIALGGSQRISFVQKLNEKLVSILVSSTVTSLITHSDFIENIALIGASALIQTGARELGFKITEIAKAEELRRNQDKVLAAAETKAVPDTVALHQDKAKEESSHLKTDSSKQATSSQQLSGNQRADLLEKVSNITSSESLAVGSLEEIPTGSALNETLAQKDLRNGFEKVRDKVLVTIASGLSQEAQAAELTPEEKALFFTYNPELHKKIFAARYLLEKPKSEKGFLAENQQLKEKEVFESSKRIASKDNQCNYTSLNTFNELMGLTDQAEQACINPRRQAEFNVGVVFDTAQLGVEMAEGIVQAGVLAEELEQPRFRQSAEVRELIDYAEKVGSLDNLLSMPKRYIQGIEERQRRAEEAFIKGDYFTAGRLANPLRPGIEVGTAVLGAVGGAKLIWNLSTATTKLSAQGLKIAAREARQFISNYNFRSPVTFQFGTLQSNAFRLNGGIPVDFVKLRSPWTIKEFSDSVIIKKIQGIPGHQLSPIGLLYPVPLLPSEVAAIRTYTSIVNLYFKKWRNIDISNLPKKTRTLLVWTKADKVIKKNMKPDDLAGIFKEKTGEKIKGKGGKLVDHMNNEWKQASQAITKVLINIKNELEGLKHIGKIDTIEAQLLQEKLSDLSKIKDLYSEIVREPLCQIEASKSKF